MQQQTEGPPEISFSGAVAGHRQQQIPQTQYMTLTMVIIFNVM